MTDRLQNPADFKPEVNPPFEHDDYNDLLFNEDGKGFMSHISYEGFWYDGGLHISKLEVETPLKVHQYLDEDVMENIRLRNNGKQVALECNVNYQ